MTIAAINVLSHIEVVDHLGNYVTSQNTHIQQTLQRHIYIYIINILFLDCSCQHWLKEKDVKQTSTIITFVLCKLTLRIILAHILYRGKIKSRAKKRCKHFLATAKLSFMHNLEYIRVEEERNQPQETYCKK